MSNLRYILECPHCGGGIEVFEKSINCKIFRHGYIKSTGQQMDPHLNKKSCDELIEKNLILGCGKPFKIVNNKTEICDYI